MICAKCGTNNDVNAICCTKCGLPLVNNGVEANVNNNSMNMQNNINENIINSNEVKYGNENNNGQNVNPNMVNQTNPNMPIEEGMKKRSNSLYLAGLGLLFGYFVNVFLGLIITIASFVMLFFEKDKIDSKSFKKAIIFDIISIVLCVGTIVLMVVLSNAV